MNQHPSCPDQDQLAALLADQLSQDEQSQLLTHVDWCSSCQQMLEQWAFDEHEWQHVADVLRNADSDPQGNAQFQKILAQQQEQPDSTIDEVPSNDSDPRDSRPPLSAKADVLHALRAEFSDVVGVQLPQPESETDLPVHPPKEHETLQQLPDRYELAGEIARGGMGAVLKGRDVNLGREIAVKVMLDTHKGKTELLQRFVEEAQIGGQLQHPGIVPVYDVGRTVNKQPYFTMKLVRGQTLASLLKQSNDERPACQEGTTGGTPVATDLPRFLGIFEQICQTLAYAHSRGVIHRDLKPANIMVGNFGEVQVMDWGLAKQVKRQTEKRKKARTECDESAGNSHSVHWVHNVRPNCRSCPPSRIAQYG